MLFSRLQSGDAEALLASRFWRALVFSWSAEVLFRCELYIMLKEADRLVSSPAPVSEVLVTCRSRRRHALSEGRKGP